MVAAVDLVDIVNFYENAKEGCLVVVAATVVLLYGTGIMVLALNLRLFNRAPSCQKFESEKRHYII